MNKRKKLLSSVIHIPVITLLGWAIPTSLSQGLTFLAGIQYIALAVVFVSYLEDLTD